MDNILKDDRFAHIIKDPKFRRIPKNERKVKIDKRFQSMFTDKKFAVSFTVDKRGKPYIQNSAENLRKYYNLSDSEDETSSDSDAEDSKEKSNKIESEEEEKEGKEIVLEKSEKKDNQLPGLQRNEQGKLSNNIKQKLKNLTVDYARGDGLLLSSSSEEEESICDSEEEETICHDWGEFDKDAEQAVETTHRLAACNMDWDKIRAVDLLVSFNSFLPSGGVILSVTIYPSEYGLKRMKEEEVKGPTELVNDSINFDENEEGSSYQMEKIRQYQLNRLKYYYAVIVCDSPETADKIWNECKNFEYESSGIRFDLRFIPDDMEFDQTPKEICDELPDFITYQPRTFITTALQQEKVDLTWDETNEERKEITQKINSGKLEELNKNELQDLIASGSSDDESDGNLETNEDQKDSDQNMVESTIDKYKNLLKSIDEKEREKHKDDVQLECTWGYHAEERSKEFEKDKQRNSESRTPFEEYLDKRKEKRKAKRTAKMEEKAKQNSDISGSEDEIPSGIDMNDPYFADELKDCAKKPKRSKKAKKDKNVLSSTERDEEKDELELILMNTDELDNKKHFDMKNIEEMNTMSKSKKKRLLRKKKKNVVNEQEDDFNMDLNDDRFRALYTSHHFNIDPADTHYRKTKGTTTLVNEQLKRRYKDKN